MNVRTLISVVAFGCVPLFAQELNLTQYLQRLKSAPGMAMADKVQYLSGIGVTLSSQGMRDLDSVASSSGATASTYNNSSSRLGYSQNDLPSPKTRSNTWNNPTKEDGTSRSWNSTTNKVGRYDYYNSSDGVSGSSNRVGNSTFYNFSNGVNGSSNKVGQFEYHNFNNGVNGSSNKVGQFEYHNFNNGVTGSSNRVGNYTYHNFNDGTRCVGTKIGSQVNTNCSK